MQLKELKKGDFFTKKNLSEPRGNQVWVRGEYCRSAKRYYCHRWDDVNDSCLMPGDRDVFCEFTF